MSLVFRPAVAAVLAGGLLAASAGIHAQQDFNQAPALPTTPMPPPTPATTPAPGQPGMGQPDPWASQPPANYPPPSGAPAAGMQPGMNPGMAPGVAPGMQPGMQPGPGNDAAAQFARMELQDYGVPPQRELQANTHGPTPTSIPGGQVITTDRLLAMYQQGMQSGGLLVFHVLGPGPTLPMAQNAVGAAQAGNFQDQTQQEFGQYLQQVSQGNKALPMVFYCQSTYCWMSYNAALRAINMGYTQVYWYRGGIEAWQAVQQMAMSQQQPGGQPPASGWQGAGYPSSPPQQPPPQQGGW
ncbi:MAG: rhodanese-like domain-containing protein [Xanthomonadales bacterium]|nr:rhodanese-like domain-containing protein [Xanthomonadales bacterium]